MASLVATSEFELKEVVTEEAVHLHSAGEGDVEDLLPSDASRKGAAAVSRTKLTFFCLALLVLVGCGVFLLVDFKGDTKGEFHDQGDAKWVVY
jgi:hypothetical protein